jgi:hypothetical protein
MFWVRSAGTAGAGATGAILFDRRPTGPGGPPGDVIVQLDSGAIFVQAASGTGGANSFETVGTINDDRWHHVAYLYDQSASGSISFYIDAIFDRSQTNTVAWSWTPGQRIELGRSHDTYWKAFNGAMDDFRIYNRILTFDEILAASEGAVVDAAALKVQFNFRTPYGAAMTWPCGTLQYTESLNAEAATWTDLPGVSSPFLLNPRTEQTRFYRIRY